MNKDDFLNNATIIRTISRRSFSSIDLVEYRGNKYVWKKMKPNGPNAEVSKELLINSFQNYKNIKNRRGLVGIYSGWWEGSSFNTIMEYFEGYERMSDLQGLFPEFRNIIFNKAMSSVSNMMRQGYTDYDVDPTNFLVDTRVWDVVMIDLDKIMRLEQVGKDRGHYGSWFATRMIRMVLWLSGSFQKHKQYTEVVKI